MRGITLALIFVAGWFSPQVLTTHTADHRQIAEAPSAHIFRIQSEACRQQPSSKSLTGFRLQGAPGIVTALHGVVGCGRLTARSAQETFTGLTIAKVDIDRDLVLLWSPKLGANGSSGLDTARLDLSPGDQPVRIIGYSSRATSPRELTDAKVADLMQLVNLTSVLDKEAHFD